MFEFKGQINFYALDKILDEFQISSGDSVYFGVDYMRFAAILGGLRLDPLVFSEKCVEKILERIGSFGTLVIPVFNFDVIPSGRFDRVFSPGQTGYLGNILLRKFFMNRSAHPFYSFLVFGYLSSHIISMNNVNATGQDSPWLEFTRNNFKLISIGHHYIRSFTIAHFFENLVGVRYRYEKDFSVIYKDFDGVEQFRTYSFYARRIDQCLFSGITKDCERLFANERLSIKTVVGSIPCYYLDLVRSSELILNSLKTGSVSLLDHVKNGESLAVSNVLNGEQLLKLEFPGL